jgi:hypothetical protein
MVGVHIRRTDKLHSEASRHEVWEYFEHVDRYFEGKNLKRPTVFIATDDPKAVKEAKESYGEKYRILNLANASKIANQRMGESCQLIFCCVICYLFCFPFRAVEIGPR